MAIVTINAVIGVVQESKAEAALDKLKDLSKGFAHVIRDGKEMKVERCVLFPCVCLQRRVLLPLFSSFRLSVWFVCLLFFFSCLVHYLI